jgi:hypothetical protein
MPRVDKALGLDSIMFTIRSTRGLSTRIAAACGVHRCAVYQWKQVPPHHMATVAEVLHLKPKDIRPDLFRRPGSR